MTDYIVPLIVAFTLIYGLCRGVDLYDALICGVRPDLSRGAYHAGGHQHAPGERRHRPVFPCAGPHSAAAGIPEECLPLALLRPFSGSGALSVGASVIAQAGPDSMAGRIAAVMLGSSETSFYTIAVYSACLGLKNTRYTLPAALCADLAAFLMSGVAVRLLMR